MFRLATGIHEDCDEILRKIITEQVIWALHTLVGINEEKNGICFDEDIFMSFIDESSEFIQEISNHTICGECGFEFIKKQFKSMYEQMIDEKYEYTFNEFQELLLSEVISLAEMIVYDFDQEIFELEDNYMTFIDNKPQISYFEKKSLFKCIRLALMESWEEFMELSETDECKELDEKVMSIIDSITSIENGCSDDTYDFLFWDWDYKLIYDMGFEGFLEFVDVYGGVVNLASKNHNNILLGQPAAKTLITKHNKKKITYL